MDTMTKDKNSLIGNTQLTLFNSFHNTKRSIVFRVAGYLRNFILDDTKWVPIKVSHQEYNFFFFLPKRGKMIPYFDN